MLVLHICNRSLQLKKHLHLHHLISPPNSTVEQMLLKAKKQKNQQSDFCLSKVVSAGTGPGATATVVDYANPEKRELTLLSRVLCMLWSDWQKSCHFLCHCESYFTYFVQVYFVLGIQYSRVFFLHLETFFTIKTSIL